MREQEDVNNAHWEIWRGFLNEQNLKHLSAQEYYGGEMEQLQDSYMTVAGTEEVLRNLLHDWVAVGALPLPDGKYAEQYDFQVTAETSSVGTRLSQFRLTDKSKGISHDFGFYYLAADTRLGSYDLRRLLRMLTELVNA